MQTYKITLTEVELNALSNLLDFAVRSQGMVAALAAVPIFVKVKEAFDAIPKLENVV